MINQKYIRELDGNICRNCGSRFFLHVHHIIFRSRVKDDSPENLITLCYKCHMLIHSYHFNIISILSRFKNRPDFRWGKALDYWKEKENVKGK